MAVAAWPVWQQGGLWQWPLALFAIQLALNAAWSWLFFMGFHLPGAAFIEVVALFAAILATTIAFWPKSLAAGILGLDGVCHPTELHDLAAEWVNLASPRPAWGIVQSLLSAYYSIGQFFLEKGKIMIETIQTGSPSIVGFKLHGKLHDDDYKTFVPAVDAAVASEGRLRLFAQFEDFHGWDMHAMWDDFKFSRKHYMDFDRIAMIGDHRWEGWMATICKPFTQANVRYFDASKVDDAWAWLREGVMAS
jgi:hypothetical protein